jgi:hypothetical protein
MRHLTHTGYYAGLTLCGAPRSVGIADGVHAAFTAPEVIAARKFPNGLELCEACCLAWEELIGDESSS